MKSISVLALAIQFVTLNQVTAQHSMGSSFGVIVYPAQEQDAATQEYDEFKCYKWAVNATGIDPADSSNDQVPANVVGPDGTIIKNTEGGAVVGAIIGAIAGDAGKGAKIGAAAGGLGGIIKKTGKDTATRQALEKAQAQDEEELDTFKKAFCTCMEGKGYSTGY